MIKHSYKGKRGCYTVEKNNAVVSKYFYHKGDKKDRRKALQKARKKDLEKPRIIV